MNRILQAIKYAGARARLTFIQSLNGLAIFVAGSIAVVREAYPGEVQAALHALPLPYQIAGLVAFGVIVHYAARTAKPPA